VTGRARSAAADPDEVAALVARIRAGEPAGVARGISWCEGGGARAESMLAALAGGAGPEPHVVGITGPPGAGKSTLVSGLVAEARARGVAVGVVAVDPSSPISGGALLGDRIRLGDTTSGDRGVFFRSVASRGAAGGLADAVAGATRVLAAAGFGLVVVETVGAGQGEVAVVGVADTVVLVLIPGAGDDLQAMKAGLMEVADVFVLNKADRPGIDDLATQVAGMLAIRGAGAGHPHGDTDDGTWAPPLVRTVARDGGGFAELWDALDRHRRFLDEHPAARTARRARMALVAARSVAEGLFVRALAAVAAHPEDAGPGLAGGLGSLAGERPGDVGRRLARAAAERLLADERLLAEPPVPDDPT
jgi:LAO/AO transport system kinase